LFIVGTEWLPDYLPAFQPGYSRADRVGRIWMRSMLDARDGIIYDVLDGTGKSTGHVQLPKGRYLVGVGAGTVYMAVQDGSAWRLERVEYRAP
jgi:hypothetical protein